EKLVAGFAIEAMPEPKVWNMRHGDEDEDADEKSDGINYEMLQARYLQLAAGQDEVVDLSRLVQIKGSKCRGYGSRILHLAGRLAPSGKLNKKPDATLQLHRKLQWRKVTFVVTHFNDPRIASEELRDLLLQSISVIV
nr:E3 ubiquitin-protein ligase RKP [Tanacetum cinerariifolium]